jgi:hypothetical protein
MDFRYLIFLMILGFPGSVLYRLPYSSSKPHLVASTDKHSRLIKFNAAPDLPDLSSDREIQVGAFRLESNAQALKERLSALLDKIVVIVASDGFFKVRITGFTSLEEMEKLLPSLGLLGIKGIWVLPEKIQEEIKIQVDNQPDTSLIAIDGKIDIPVVPEMKPVLAEPTIILQIGVFHNRSTALRAQRRITTKLSLPVEIIQEWEFSKVIATGFKTREETFKYYPELAHMGYHNVIIIEDFKKK